MNIFRAMSAMYLVGVMSFGGGMTWYMNGFTGASYAASTPRSMFFSMSDEATAVLTVATAKRSAVQSALSSSAKRCLSKMQGSEVPSALMELVSNVYWKITEMPDIRNHVVPSAGELDSYLGEVSSKAEESFYSRLSRSSEFNRLKMAAHFSNLADNSSEHAQCTYETAYAELVKSGVIQAN